MTNNAFYVFGYENYMDLMLYQYGREQCTPLHSYGPYIRNHYLFHYVISGKGTLQITGKDTFKEYSIERGSGFLIEPGQIITYCADRLFPWEYMWIEFDGMKANEYMKEAGLSSSSPVMSPISPQLSEQLKDEMIYLISHSNESSRQLIGHLYLIVDAIIQCSSNRKKIQGGKISRLYTQEAIGYIEQYYSCPITIEDLAKRCNLDKSYFGKVFKESMGQSPQDFLIRYRMNKASELLITTDLPINSICVQVGYMNQLHFSRAFKNIYGVSPRTYRQNKRLIPQNSANNNKVKKPSSS